jgi:hypothetical protein
MNYDQILKDTKRYVTTFITSTANANLVYHNKMHIEDVVSAATKIAHHYHLSENDFFTIIAAVRFNNLGFYLDYAFHQGKAAEEASAFFEKKGVDQITVNAITECILSTYSMYPQTLLQKIVCDAEMFYLGTTNFRKQNKLQRKEYRAMNDAEISKEEWRLKTIKMISSHNFQTGYCQLLLNTKKEEILRKLRRKDAKESAYYTAAALFGIA